MKLLPLDGHIVPRQPKGGEVALPFELNAIVNAIKWRLFIFTDVPVECAKLVHCVNVEKDGILDKISVSSRSGHGIADKNQECENRPTLL